MFSTISVATIINTDKSGGDGYRVLFGSAICSLIMTIILLYQKRFIWTWLEKLIVILIAICLTVWYFKGAYNALVLSVISESIVGIYLMIKTIKKPVVKYNLTGYTLFLFSCIIAVFDAEHWTLEDVGYNLSEIVITSITIIPLLLKWQRDRKLNEIM
jgi:hypothetical protein